MNGVFVTGTDTGVGKTAVTAGLAANLQEKHDVGVVKPVQTGCMEEDKDLVSPDPRFVKELGVKDVYCPLELKPPLAPRVAAETQGIEIDYDSILKETRRAAQRHGYTIIEGAGGIRVPITSEHEVIDLMHDLDLPALVVTRPALGTLNHTALTIESLNNRGVDVNGVVINRYPDNPGPAEETNPDEIESMTDSKVIAKIPDLDLDTQTKGINSDTRRDLIGATRQIADHLTQ